jgi:hypothetical protein
VGTRETNKRAYLLTVVIGKDLLPRETWLSAVDSSNSPFIPLSEDSNEKEFDHDDET